MGFGVSLFRHFKSLPQWASSLIGLHLTWHGSKLHAGLTSNASGLWRNMSKHSIQKAYCIMLVTITAQGFLTQNLSWICNLPLLDHFCVASQHPKHHEVLANSCTSVPSPNITKGAPPLTPFTWGSMWHLPPPRGVIIRAQPKNACRKITRKSEPVPTRTWRKLLVSPQTYWKLLHTSSIHVGMWSKSRLHCSLLWLRLHIVQNMCIYRFYVLTELRAYVYTGVMSLIGRNKCAK